MPSRHGLHQMVLSSHAATRFVALQDGLVFVQDEASQLVPAVVAAARGERVLDLCASPGGKTVAMAADMNDVGTIIASDVRPKRLALLQDTVKTADARSVTIVRVPPMGPLPFAATFDAVLVDAPCSGLGTVRRDPDIRWRRREQDLVSLARDQLALLLARSGRGAARWTARLRDLLE